VFGTDSFHQTQVSFNDLIIELLNLRVGGSIWLSPQLQLQKNKILVGIVPYAIEMMF
jgi:hypothetical protein